jgi:hypothetical protein
MAATASTDPDGLFGVWSSPRADIMSPTGTETKLALRSDGTFDSSRLVIGHSPAAGPENQTERRGTYTVVEGEGEELTVELRAQFENEVYFPYIRKEITRSQEFEGESGPLERWHLSQDGTVLRLSTTTTTTDPFAAGPTGGKRTFRSAKSGDSESSPATQDMPALGDLWLGPGPLMRFDERANELRRDSPSENKKRGKDDDDTGFCWLKGLVSFGKPERRRQPLVKPART